MGGHVTISAGTRDDVALLEPLWVSVHHRHSASMPELAPYLDDAATWTERRAVYEQLLEKPDTILLLAHVEDELAGYGLAHVVDVWDTWLADTWVTGQRIGEIESLGVLPAHRNAGIGTQLLNELEERLGAAGVDDVMIGALAGNTAALRLYERHGYRPTWLYMTRLSGRR